MQPKQKTYDNGLLAAFSLLILLLIGSAGISYLNTKQLHEDMQLVRHTHEIIETLGSILSTAKDMETGQRGYLITGEVSYLEPYQGAIRNITHQLEDLERYTVDGSLPPEVVTGIASNIDDLKRELRKTIELRTNEGFTKARDNVLTNRGKAEMDLLRDGIHRLSEDQHELLNNRSRIARSSFQTAIVSGLVATVLGILTVILLIYFVFRRIQDREETTQKLHREREQLRITFESIGDGVISTDLNGNITMLNPVAEYLTGFRSKEAIGKPLDSIYRIVEHETGEPLESPSAKILRGQNITDSRDSAMLLSKDGHRWPISDRAAPMTGLDRDILGTVLVFRDVSNERMLQTALNSRIRLLSLRADIGISLSQSASLHEALQACCDSLLENLDGALARIWTYSPSTKTLNLEGSAGLYTQNEGPYQSVVLGETKIGHIGEKRQPYLTNTTLGDPMFPNQEWIKNEHLISFAGYPLVIGKRLMGVMALYGRAPLEDYVLDAMAAVAREIATSIGHMRAQQLISEHQELLEVTLSSIADAVLTTDAQGRITFINEAAQTLTGWTLKEAVGKPANEVFKIYNELSGHEAESPVDTVLRENKVVGFASDTVLVDRQGKKRPIDDNGAPIVLDGEIIGAALVFRDVTERRKAEQQLEESRAFLSQVMDALSAQIAVLDEAGNILMVNAAWKQFASTNGYLDKQFGVGQNYLKISTTTGHGEASDEGSHVAKGIQEVLDRKLSQFEMEYPCHSPEEQAWFMMRVTRFESSDTVRAVVAHENITSRVLAEASVRESEERFRNLADNMSQLAWMADEKGNIFWYNQRWFDYTGTTLEAMQGWGWKAVHHPDHVDRVVKKVQWHWDHGVVWEDTFPLRSKEGEYRWFLSRAMPIFDEDQNLVRWFGTNTDITDYRKLEQALLEADERKNQFLATLGHELRNPLAGILGGVQVLSTIPTASAEQIAAQEVIARQGQFMGRLIDDLLDVSRIIKGKITLQKDVLSLKPLVEEVIQDAKQACDERKIRLLSTLPKGPVYCSGDRERLRQVFTNLINNACKFSQDDTEIAIFLEEDHEAKLARFMIRDVGIGMTVEMLENIFHPFSQADHSLERSRGGLGLGLAIVHGLLELHGGQIRAASEGLGKGSTFTIELPLVDDLPKTKRVREKEYVLDQHLKILVIDDRRDASFALTNLFQKEGHQVFTAQDGPTGVSTALSELPDVVVCDIGLPGFDGYEVARQIRASGQLKNAFLVAATGYGQPQDRQNALEAGFNTHFIKPVEFRKLCHAIAAWIHEIGSDASHERLSQ